MGGLSGAVWVEWGGLSSLSGLMARIQLRRTLFNVFCIVNGVGAYPGSKTSELRSIFPRTA